MNACPSLIHTLACHESGKGYLRSAWTGGNRLQLFKDDGEQFPNILTPGGFYFVTVHDKCTGKCETVQVNGREGDDLVIESTSPDHCFPTNSIVQYHLGAQFIRAVAREIGLNVRDPLVYDCDTNTLSIDCHKLAMDPDCGCGSTGLGAPGGGSPGAGLPGPPGRNGDDGIGIRTVELGPNNELYVTLTDNRVVTAGIIKTVQGPRGDTGAPGRDGKDGVAPEVREVERLWIEADPNMPGLYRVKASYTGQFSGVGVELGTFDVPAIRTTTAEEMAAINQKITALESENINLRAQLTNTQQTLQGEIANLSSQLQGQVAMNAAQSQQITTLQQRLDAFIAGSGRSGGGSGGGSGGSNAIIGDSPGR